MAKSTSGRIHINWEFWKDYECDGQMCFDQYGNIIEEKGDVKEKSTEGEEVNIYGS